MKVYLEYESHILIQLKGGHRIFGSYVPPSDSPYYSDKYFNYLSSFLTPTDSTFSVIRGGDLNSRVGVVSHLPPINGSYYRKNPDEAINSHGKMLKKICKVYNFYIINNLTNVITTLMDILQSPKATENPRMTYAFRTLVDYLI